MTIRYEQDFYGWTQEQAELLRSGHLEKIDLEHLIEEIESMGRGEKRELEHRLMALLQHLLKWQFQPSHQGRSWRLTIQEQRREIPDVLEDNPSLKPALDAVMAKAYAKARKAASQETDIPEITFPEQCQWTFDQAVNPEFFPGQASATASN